MTIHFLSGCLLYGSGYIQLTHGKEQTAMARNTSPHPATAIHTAAPQRKKPGEDYGELASAEADSGRVDAILFLGSYRKS